MKILMAEDDAFSRKLLEATLGKAGHDVVSCDDGEAAIEAYEKEPSIEMAILDWMMPGKDGLEVCREIKANEGQNLTYIIMLTAKSRPDDLALAMDSGADDFVSKPFNAVELNARINAGVRMIRLQKAMADNIQELQEALAHVEQLQGIIPICAWCKKIRDDSQYWSSVEDYIGRHSKAEFSHSVCPECLEKHFPDEADEIADSTDPVTQPTTE